MSREELNKIVVATLATYGSMPATMLMGRIMASNQKILNKAGADTIQSFAHAMKCMKDVSCTENNRRKVYEILK